MSATYLPSAILNRITPSTSGCWLWTGTINHAGYGHVWWYGRTRRVHRLVWSLLIGDPTPGLEFNHKCGVKSCVNPAHLEECTSLYNTNQKPGVNKSHCLRGHAMSADNTRTQIRGGHIHRSCKTCARERKALLRVPVALASDIPGLSRRSQATRRRSA